MKIQIKQETDDAAINLAIDTIKINRQALIFVNTKKSSEKTAEEISKKLKISEEALDNLSTEILNSLSRPTTQCERLYECVRKGVAFHHSGLTSKQRELIENNFRNGNIKIICATTTLAFGLDLPAYRAILKDLRRYTQRGLTWIPVLEYLQMAGRSGRPNYDTKGEAIAIAETKAVKEKIEEKYLNGEPEEIYSKLAVEPVLRAYVLSLIATGFVTTKKELIEFFAGTFFAFQFKDLRKIKSLLQKILNLLDEWEFIMIKGDSDFIDAANIDNELYQSTILGKRVSELYIDPLTANHLINCLRDASDKKTNEFSFLQAISCTLELRPLLRVGIRERNFIQEEFTKKFSYIVSKEPSIYEPEYEEFLSSVKTALMFNEWIEEKDENFLLEQYGIRPGEIRAKLEIADWLLYSTGELCKLLHYQSLVKHVVKLRLRMRYGAKEELLPLLKLEGVGRVRARALYRNNIRDIGDVKKADISTLKYLLGEKTAMKVKGQAGDERFIKISGELSLSEWG